MRCNFFFSSLRLFLFSVCLSSSHLCAFASLRLCVKIPRLYILFQGNNSGYYNIPRFGLPQFSMGSPMTLIFMFVYCIITHGTEALYQMR